MLAQSPPAKLPGWRDLNPAAVVAGLLVTLALAVAYAPNFVDLVRRWWADPNANYGFLVIPIALTILWQRRDVLIRQTIRPSILGWAGLVLILGVRAYLYHRNEQWIETTTFPLAVA